MGFIKKLLLATLVFVISAGIFFLLVKEQEVKDNILRASLEMFGNELLAMVPDGPEKDRLTQQMNQFIDKAENNEVPKAQIQEVVSAGLNMQMNQNQIPPEKLEAMLDISMDTSMTRKGRRHPIRTRGEEEQLAHQIRRMIHTQKEMQRLMASDSMRAAMQQQILFDQDSTGLVLVLPHNFPQQDRKVAPEIHEQLKKLERENMVRYEDMQEIQKLARLGLEYIVPIIPQPDRKKVMQEMQKWQQNMADSLNIPSFVFDPDSLEAFIKKMQQQAEAENQNR